MWFVFVTNIQLKFCLKLSVLYYSTVFYFSRESVVNKLGEIKDSLHGFFGKCVNYTILNQNIPTIALKSVNLECKLILYIVSTPKYIVYFGPNGFSSINLQNQKKQNGLQYIS